MSWAVMSVVSMGAASAAPTPLTSGGSPKLPPAYAARVIGEAELRDRMAGIRWFHSIELAPGVVTPGLDDTRRRVDVLALPDLAGRSVLDVGAWDGFFSFEA